MSRLPSRHDKKQNMSVGGSVFGQRSNHSGETSIIERRTETQMGAATLRTVAFWGVGLTGGPLSPTPGSPGSPLGPRFPGTATALPRSAGSTGHTSHGSPCRSHTKWHGQSNQWSHAKMRLLIWWVKNMYSFSILYLLDASYGIPE